MTRKTGLYLLSGVEFCAATWFAANALRADGEWVVALLFFSAAYCLLAAVHTLRAARRGRRYQAPRS